MTKKTEPKVGDLRVWHNCQVGAVKNFYVDVSSVEEGKAILVALADYDAFQFENRIKGDYANASGLCQFEANAGEGEPGWCEWMNEETGEEIWDMIRSERDAVEETEQA